MPLGAVSFFVGENGLMAHSRIKRTAKQTSSEVDEVNNKQDVAETKDREKRKVTNGFVDFCNTRGVD